MIMNINLNINKSKSKSKSEVKTDIFPSRGVGVAAKCVGGQARPHDIARAETKTKPPAENRK
jgi:hypothetical protein